MYCIKALLKLHKADAYAGGILHCNRFVITENRFKTWGGFAVLGIPPQKMESFKSLGNLDRFQSSQ